MSADAGLLFIAAEPREFAGFLPHIAGISPAGLPAHWSRHGVWKTRPVVLIANGAGPERSAAAAMANSTAAAIINVGFCGALDFGLKIGDVVVADRVFYNNQMFDCQAVSTSQDFRRGVVYSSPRIAATASEKQQLRATGAIAVEMEAGGILSVLLKQDRAQLTRFYCVRAVSDLAGESFENDFGAALGPDGRYRMGSLIGSALRRPHRRFPELLRLKQRCDLAAKNLGEFLDSCSF